MVAEGHRRHELEVHEIDEMLLVLAIVVVVVLEQRIHSAISMDVGWLRRRWHRQSDQVLVALLAVVDLVRAPPAGKERIA